MSNSTRDVSRNWSDGKIVRAVKNEPCDMRALSFTLYFRNKIL